MPLSADRELLKHEMRVQLMAIQTKHFEAQARCKPWKAMAVAAEAGAGVITLVLHSIGR